MLPPLKNNALSLVVFFRGCFPRGFAFSGVLLSQGAALKPAKGRGPFDPGLFKTDQGAGSRAPCRGSGQRPVMLPLWSEL